MTELSFLLPPGSKASIASSIAMPDYFVDLNLDQIEQSLFVNKASLNLTDVFRSPLTNPQDVQFRQSFLQDLEHTTIRESIDRFIGDLARIRDFEARKTKTYYSRQKEWWLLEAIRLYAATVSELRDHLSVAQCKSQALIALVDYLSTYVDSSTFKDFTREAQALSAELHSIRYTVLIRGLRVDVRNEVDAQDYGAEVQNVFSRFRQGDVSRYSFEFRDDIEMNHVEAQILDGVAGLNPDLFGRIKAFSVQHDSFVDLTIARFDREVQFYLSYLDYIQPLKQSRLPFCYPNVSDTNTSVTQGFDLALGQKLLGPRQIPVLNDFSLSGAERIVVVSGPNQGGKTTFARMVGQLHHIAALGYPLPAVSVDLALPDRIFTHFERQEQLKNLRGKLEDDIYRIHAILDKASDKSLVLINEMFTSTSLRDAIFLSKNVAAKLLRIGCRCLWVTFLDELSVLGPETVSMTSMVKEENTAERTFKVIRRPADGHAYAMSVAEKYHLTFDNILERIADESASSVS